MYYDDDEYYDRYQSEITLEKALFKVAPIFVNSLLKKHPSLMLAFVIADLAVEVRNNRKAKRKFGELKLIHC